MKKRIVSIEILRILAMIMVVMLHYLGKGNLLQPLTGELTANGYVAWGLESLSIVAVNVYMLISGYFLVESGCKPGRLVELLCQVLFYTILIPVVLIVLGIVSMENFTLNDILLNLLPVQMKQYWFITAYVVMYLFSPVLSIAAKAMTKGQLKNTVIALLLFFSVSKSVLPFELALDSLGYDGLWFLCVFLLAAYIRLHGISFFTKGKGSRRGFLCYFAGCAGIFILTLAIRAFYLKTGSLDHVIQSAFAYNHILNLFAAVSLFYGFLQLELSGEGIGAKLIYKAAPCSLGVYLLHEQLELRNLWPKWLGASIEGNPLIFVGRCVTSVLLVYLAGTLIDGLRGLLFSGIKRLIKGN